MAAVRFGTFMSNSSVGGYAQSPGGDPPGNCTVSSEMDGVLDKRFHAHGGSGFVAGVFVSEGAGSIAGAAKSVEFDS